MLITFHLSYKTAWGQKLCISGNIPELGNNNPAIAFEMQHEGEGEWEAIVEIDNQYLSEFSYKYFVKDENYGIETWEWGKARTIDFSVFPEMEVRDFWRSPSWESNTWFSSAFTKAIMQREKGTYRTELKITGEEPVVIFRLNAARIAPHLAFAIIGNDTALGAWDESNPLILEDSNYPVWQVTVGIQNPKAVIYYKYVIYNLEEKKIEEWEQGDDRQLSLFLNPEKDQILYQQTDESFGYKDTWKGAGVAIPVFSLRSAGGTGVGEFPDLKLLTDWAKKTDMKLVQILPINDTIANHTWTDSYPYAAISVFALHPMYINLHEMGKLQDADLQAQFDAEAEQLNQLSQIDYEAVMNMKSRFFKLLFDQEKDNFLANPDFQTFLAQNQDWLKPYSVFSHLRDLYKTPDFSKWKIGNVFNWDEIHQMCAENDEHFEHIAVHYFIQYHAHLQLLSATQYARKQGVALKGDIPIGIYRYSVDAWMAPHLYNMNAQAGAPPDDFAVKGQNWGFPTYNWEEMAKDGYAWWKQRLTHLSYYFHAFRIDHILGFFRIWQIPMAHIDGLMGIFNPTLPLSAKELRAQGLILNYDRLCKPYIREHFLYDIFGQWTEEVKKEYLTATTWNQYELKPHVSTQSQVETLFQNKEDSLGKNERVKAGLMELITEVLFIDDAEGGLNPRITLQKTRSFRELEDDQKWRVETLYNHYFFDRMNDFWREKAMQKLPALINATDMLICGEDLGMIPASVAGVMKELNILSLEIQRMPKGNVEFGHPNHAPYLSVVTPSSHDMSTIRGWWEEDRNKTQKFYNEILQNHGEAPLYCEPWICKQIIEQHAYSPAMWVIFPIQDLVALDGNLRRENPQEEQINVPANPKHYWRFRFHLNIEQLLQADGLNTQIQGIVRGAGRN